LPKPELERSVQILIPKMEFASLEQEAERKAATHVANMLHTPALVTLLWYSLSYFNLALVTLSLPLLLWASLDYF